jgi:hypothetical protein
MSAANAAALEAAMSDEFKSIFIKKRQRKKTKKTHTHRSISLIGYQTLTS